MARSRSVSSSCHRSGRRSRRYRDRSRSRGKNRRRSRKRENSTDMERRKRLAQLEFMQQHQKMQALDAGVSTTDRMLWDGFQWIPKIGDETSIEHNANRKDRRLYAANLPIEKGLTEDFLKQQIFVLMKDKGLLDKDARNPILHIWFARGKNMQYQTSGDYGFIEFSSVVDAAKAVALDGTIILGQPVSFKRPNDSQITPDIQQLTSPSNASDINTQKIISVANIATSRVVKLDEMLIPDRKTRRKDYIELLDDVKTVLSGINILPNIFVCTHRIQDPLNGNTAASSGDVFLELEDVFGAENCVNSLKRFKYNKSLIRMACVHETPWVNLIRPVIEVMTHDLML